MNINKMTDEELCDEIRGLCIANIVEDVLVMSICQCVRDSQPEIKWPEKKDIIGLQCYCDGSGNDIYGYCNCEFSNVDGWNEAIDACKQAVEGGG